MKGSRSWVILPVAALIGAAWSAAGSSSSAAAGSTQHPLRPPGANAGPTIWPPYREIVNLPTFMEHVLSPAADIVWRASGTSADASGEHDLTPATDAQWEAVVSGSATLAEATNALMIPQRERDAAWYSLAIGLADAAESAYRAAEAHDAKAIALAGERIDGACTKCHKHYGVE